MKERPDYYYTQSSVIPVRRRDNHLEILLITSRKSKRWIVPKGIIESGLSPLDAAAKKALEEAGVLGQVFPEILGTFDYEKWGGTCSVQVFVMEVTQVKDLWLENFRSRVWLDWEDAIRRIDLLALQDVLKKLPDFLGKNRLLQD